MTHRRERQKAPAHRTWWRHAQRGGTHPATPPKAKRHPGRRDMGEMVLREMPRWGAPLFDELIETLMAVHLRFPCLFAVAAVRKRALRVGFVDDLDDPSTWGTLVDDMRHYLTMFRTLSRDTSFVVFFRPEEHIRTVEEYHERFWAVLRHLSEHDEVPWPADIPQDPEHPKWEYCFGGEPMFVVCNTPAHQERRSRHSSTFMITFQPRWVFETIGPETRRGRQSRRVIRRRLRVFDRVHASPYLGNYGERNNREWRQYFLADTNRPTTARCPFGHEPPALPDATGNADAIPAEPFVSEPAEIEEHQLAAERLEVGRILADQRAAEPAEDVDVASQVGATAAAERP